MFNPGSCSLSIQNNWDVFFGNPVVQCERTRFANYKLFNEQNREVDRERERVGEGTKSSVCHIYVACKYFHAVLCLSVTVRLNILHNCFRSNRIEIAVLPELKCIFARSRMSFLRPKDVSRWQLLNYMNFVVVPILFSAVRRINLTVNGFSVADVLH